MNRIDIDDGHVALGWMVLPVDKILGGKTNKTLCPGH